MRPLPALLALLLSLSLGAACRADTASAPAAAHCPAPDEVEARHLYGQWRAEFTPTGPSISLLLERHPDLAGSVRGVMLRDGERAWVSGDVDGGDFTLEESVNGRNISATWLGEVVPGSCGREIRGQWSTDDQTVHRQFILHKVAD
ncbi:MAG: hypothetical protein JOY84_04635 [Curvibacter sp.]|nr:hypothetical protein [Curvibacter sp.]